jgi:hypothetical protein
MSNIILTIILALLFGSQPVGVQQENARDIFLESRKPPENSAKGNSPNQGQPSKGNAAKLPASAAPKIGRPRPRRRRSQNPQNVYVVANSKARTVGLGYTLFLKDGPERLIRVSSNRVFYTEQAVRLLVESNIDGYLYVFHQENNGQPKMLFPSWIVHEGNNQILAHEPVMIPSATLAEFVFTKNPAIETLTIVVSRTPILNLPIGKSLQGIGKVILPYSLLEDIIRPCQCYKSVQDAEGQVVSFEDASRDIELRASDPQPAYIYVNEERSLKRLSVQVKLIHK